MLIFAVCPVMTARGLVTPRRRVVVMYPNHFCEDVGIPVERLPLLSVYLGNQETPITTNVVEASDGVIQRKIKSGDRGNVQVIHTGTIGLDFQVLKTMASHTLPCNDNKDY